MLCTVALFMKETESVKNYCRVKVEPNSILPKAQHITHGLWFISIQSTLVLMVVCPQKKMESLIINPPIGIIKLNMFCTATSSYIPLLSYHCNKSKSNIQDEFIDNVKS